MSASKKVVLIGHFGVGKTSLMKRFIDNSFSEDYKVTLGVQIQKKSISLKNECKLSFIIWDLEGNTSITKTRASYLLGANAFIYVFDATRTETFSNLNDELEYIYENYPDVKIKVIGNKADLVSEKAFIGIMKSKKLPYDYITSAKTGKNVNKMFEELAEELIEQT